VDKNPKKRVWHKNSKGRPFFSKNKKPALTGPKTIDGVIRITRRNFGIVRYGNADQAIIIKPELLGSALTRDEVRVEVKEYRRDGTGGYGRVTEILRRAKVGYAGIVKNENGVDVFYATDSAFPSPARISEISVPKEELTDGKIVFFELAGWDPERKPFGKIIKIIGEKSRHESIHESIALEYGFVAGFPDEVLKEAEIFVEDESTNDYKDRRDFRGVTTFTIDPDTAKDFDDALSYERIDENTIEVGVHIADVSHYVQTGSALDNEARSRGTSVYLADRVIPMLPEILSNDLCSLVPNEDRRVMSCVVTFVNNEVKSAWFGKAIIHSDERLSYEQAQERIETKEGQFAKEIEHLNTIAHNLKQKRFDAGAISLDSDEVKFTVDEDGYPISVSKKRRKDAHKMIEEFMLLANRLVAQEIGRTVKGKQPISEPMVFRVHDKPTDERIASLEEFLNGIGHDIALQNETHIGAKLSDLLDSIADGAMKDTVQSAIVRSMSKAIYTTKNIGHFGLAIAFYTHFTSPIRRYPDVIVHRLLNHFVTTGNLQPEDIKELERVSAESSIQESGAQNAERASNRYLGMLYLAKHVGQIRKGVITGLTERGCFVKDEESFAEGFMSFEGLGDVVVSEKTGRAKIEGSGRVLSLGEIIDMKVKAVDEVRREIEMELV